MMMMMIIVSINRVFLKVYALFVNLQLPPVRNSLLKKKKKKVLKAAVDTGKQEQHEKRIRGYDYRAWDKFDVVSDAVVSHSVLTAADKFKITRNLPQHSIDQQA